MANVTKSADFSKPCKLYCSWLHNFLTSTFSSLPNLIVAILSLSLLYFPLFLTFNIWGDTIRGHQITVDTIPAHNFGINKFLHPSAITKFYIYFFPAKNTGSYSAQKPENPLKLGLFARANTPSPHAQSSQTGPRPGPSGSHIHHCRGSSDLWQGWQSHS